MTIKTLRIVVIGILLLSSQFTAAANRYVAPAPTGSDTSNTCLTQTSPCLTLQRAFSQMASGDVLIIASGTYSGTGNDLNNNIPNGTAPATYTVIQAQTDGGVEITSAFQIGSDNTRKSYIEFRGLKINSATSKSIIGHHIKVFRTAFQGGPNGDNTMNLGIGTIGPTTGTAVAGADHILLEDVWSYGFGGRYNILLYNTEDVIIRRAIIRHDGGWTLNVSSDPEAGITIYDSRRVQLQNVIVLDSIADSPNWASAFYNVHNNTNNQMPHDMTRTVGSMALNNPNPGTAFAWDDSLSMTNAVLENSVAYNSGTSITSNGSDKFVTLLNVTIYGSGSVGIAKYGNGGAYTISNTIIYGKAGNAFSNGASSSSTTNVLCFANVGSDTTGCDITATNPTTNGLLYLPRTESNSYLDLNNIGANIVFRTGASGTYYDDANSTVETSEALWPWPYQERIFTDMCAVRMSAMCSAGNVTNYIWGLLGNAVPTEFTGMPTPTNVRITKN